MSEPKFCPECGEHVETQEALDRRDFIRVVGQGAAAVALGSMIQVPATAADTPATPAKSVKPAEELIRELFSGLSDEQKQQVVKPFTDPARLQIYNRALGTPIGKVYTKAQQELVDRILRAMCNGDEGYTRITREGKFDNTGSFENCGANIFGDPSNGQKFTFVFTSHHLTCRCDGNSEEGAAFGGPLYYGHIVNGYSPRNQFFFQTKSVMSVYDALSEKQRKVAVLSGSPGEGLGSVRFRPADQPKPGISFGELNKDQQALVETVMRDLLAPFRKEDGDEVMQIVKANGGLQKLHLAFYGSEPGQWHFWRVEGPGFVWNFRPLPHVHTYVNISSKV
jgi:hypothetical protein